MFAAVIVASCFVVAWLRQSHLGIALRSIRDAPGYTAARGVNPRSARVVAFGLSGFLAGVAGGFYLAFEQSFTTSQMGLTPMSIDVTMLVIGGLGTVFGPLIGTAIVTVIQTILIDYPGWQLTILGATLLVIVIFVPGGVVGADLPHLQAGGRLGRGGLGRRRGGRDLARGYHRPVSSRAEFP